MKTKEEIEKEYQQQGKQLVNVIINGIADNLVNNHGVVMGIINNMYNLRVDHEKLEREAKKEEPNAGNETK